MKLFKHICFLSLPLFAAGTALAEDTADRHRQVVVDGQGEVSVAPDRARLQMGVTHVDANLLMVEARVNEVVRAFLTAARALGLKDQQIDSSGTSIQPEYVWDEEQRSNRLVGYRVSRDIVVQVERLDTLGDIMRRATEAGINQMQAPQLEHSRARQIQQQALVEAARDARDRATLLAETLDMRLGPLHRLHAAEAAPQPPMPKLMSMRADMAAEGGNSGAGIATGMLRFAATVQAEFELLLP